VYRLWDPYATRRVGAEVVLSTIDGSFACGSDEFVEVGESGRRADGEPRETPAV
jgi:hypothetical protein